MSEYTRYILAQSPGTTNWIIIFILIIIPICLLAWIIIKDRMTPSTQEQRTKQDLMEVAKWQKNIMWMIPLSLAAMLIKYATIVTGIIQIYFIYKLAVAVRSSAAWAYIILAFCPFVGLLALLHINGKATKILKANGIKVGLMGARMADFDNITNSEE